MEYTFFLSEWSVSYKRHDIVNYDEVRQQILSDLESLQSRPKRVEVPVIYHLDVGAMYPNIILTNRLQPCSIVNRDKCSSCAYNHVYRPSLLTITVRKVTIVSVSYSGSGVVNIIHWNMESSSP